MVSRCDIVHDQPSDESDDIASQAVSATTRLPTESQADYTERLRDAAFWEVRQNTGSRVNQACIVLGIDLVKKLLDKNPTASVMILTGYNAQARLYQVAKELDVVAAQLPTIQDALCRLGGHMTM
ncbi:hypothetical protein PV08_06377 [Exophiala spinifera]|uniref:DNA2/NAM7 helicase-like C-terminal domain-containing protein n=1 Tax=Exophiala spinifera TaxID=91928 RepID=A0A0D1YMQ3_9EURO|nr:uncharacterized protein PV08_06377 [Exophiala spinifera]KIW16326.1 hypothetical protein PV08_06377 [Exophiala spinifera]